MKRLLIISVPVVLIGVAYFQFLGTPPKSIEVAATWVHQALSQRDVQFQGLNHLSEEAARRLLPQTRSNLWWRSSLSHLGEKLAQHPWIERARVEACSFWSVQCYRIEVVERVPAFIAEVDGNRWLVDEQGSFIVRVTGETPLAYPLASGVLSAGQSPDVARGRLRFLARASRELEQQLGLKPRHMAFKAARDIEVSFHGTDFRAIMSASPTAPERLSREVQRLARLLEEFQGKHDRIAQVDLAFQNTAVVHLKK